MSALMREYSRFVNRRIRPVVAHCREKWRRRFHPTYDEELFDVMLQALHVDSCCIDIGAHKGAILRDILTIAPRGHHYAFEPLPYLADQLGHDFPHVTVHASAVATQSGRAEFIHVENHPAYSGLRERVYDCHEPQLVKIEVPVVRLDEVPIEHRIRLIKLDTEGGEYDAIVSGQNLIRRCHPYLAFEGSEWTTGKYGTSASQVADTLQSWGYGLYTMERWLRRRPAFTREQFIAQWEGGSEYFWLAAPTLG